jgi:hypothetical protein
MYDKIFVSKLIRYLLCGLLLIQMGCATTTGGVVDVGRILNTNKQLEETVAVSTLAAYKATVAALRELNMSITAEYGDGTSVELRSKSVDNEMAWIEITSISAVSCKVTVSVDVFADESRSRSILTYILKNLSDKSTASELHQIKDNMKQSENQTTGTFQQPAQNDEEWSTGDTHSEELKPLPKEVVTEKSLL